MPPNKLIYGFLFVLASLFFLPLVSGNIDIEFRPNNYTSTVGETVSLALYFVSDSDEGQNFSVANVLFFWDTEYLNLLGKDDTGATYSLFSGFNNNPSGVNENITDGNALYAFWSQIGEQTTVAPEGTLITTFQFETIQQTDDTLIDIVSQWTNPSGEGLTAETAIVAFGPITVTGTWCDAGVRILNDPSNAGLI